MRWKEISKREGSERVIKRFLFLPRFANGEWRWLEFATIRQVLRKYYSAEAGIGVVPPWDWDDKEWIDKKR